MSDISLHRPVACARSQGLGIVFHWLAVARSRRDLARLDAAALEDIGMSAEQAQIEAARPLWDAPSRWVKS